MSTPIVSKGSLVMHRLARGINAGTSRPAVVTHVHDRSTSKTAEVETRVALTVFIVPTLDGEGEQTVADARCVPSAGEAQQGECYLDS